MNTLPVVPAATEDHTEDFQSAQSQKSRNDQAIQTCKERL